MKSPTLTDADRREADAIRPAIRCRPGYRLARAWADDRLIGPAPTPYPTTLARIAEAIGRSTGARLEIETVAVALEDSGIPLLGLKRYRDGTIDGEVAIDEHAVLDTIGQVPARPWGLVWSDDEAEALQ